MNSNLSIYIERVLNTSYRQLPPSYLVGQLFNIVTRGNEDVFNEVVSALTQALPNQTAAYSAAVHMFEAVGQKDVIPGIVR